MKIIDRALHEQVAQYHLGDLDLSKSYAFFFTTDREMVGISEKSYTLARGLPLLLSSSCLIVLHQSLVLDCLLAYPSLLDRSRSSEGFCLVYDRFIRELGS